MDAGLSTARQARAHHRHELRTLTYVTLDQANGGIVRNLTHEGIGAQVVAAVRPRQQLRVRFELRYPRLRVETRGEVIWATFSGQCGIRFLDLSPRLVRQIDEWVFGSLLEGAAMHPESGSMFPRPDGAESDGLIVSPAPLKIIELPRLEPKTSEQSRAEPVVSHADMDCPKLAGGELDWLSQPLSGRGLAWTVNSLVVVGALLLFVLVFLSITREAPKRPFAMASGALLVVAALYWGFFKIFGGLSPGARLVRVREAVLEDDASAGDTVFR